MKIFQVLTTINSRRMSQQLSHHCKKQIDRDSEFEIPGDCGIFASDTYI